MTSLRNNLIDTILFAALLLHHQRFATEIKILIISCAFNFEYPYHILGLKGLKESSRKKSQTPLYRFFYHKEKENKDLVRSHRRYILPNTKNKYLTPRHLIHPHQRMNTVIFTKFILEKYYF